MSRDTDARIAETLREFYLMWLEKSRALGPTFPSLVNKDKDGAA